MSSYVDDYISVSVKRMEKNGELKNNAYRGKPLDLTDYFKSPKETRALNRYLSDAGVAPPKIEILKQLRKKQQEHALHPSETLKKDIMDLQLKYDVLR